MATYKVIQDIEAEDKILGPLTLRQFIFGLITAFLLYICFLCVTKGAAFLLVVLLPPALFTGFFAFPFGRDQSTEVWALAKIRYFLKPRRRIWDQNGMKDLVTVTVPKKIERIFTDGLSENEVKSRLQALASTIDSRGWAIKNVNVNMYSQPSQLDASTSDRLIDINSMPHEVPNFDVQASDDMLDEQTNPIAHQFDQMIASSTQTHRKQLIDELNGIRADEQSKTENPPNDYWFMHQSTPPSSLPADQTVFSASPVVHPGAADVNVTADETPAEREMVEHFKEQNDTQKISYAHMRTIQPLHATSLANDMASDSSPQVPTTDATPAAPVMTAPHDAAILSLASNNDLNVSTLAREANKAKNLDQPPQDEVVISLR